MNSTTMGNETDLFDAGSLRDLLPVYYKRLFPFDPYFRWLCYGNLPEFCFANREFCFTLEDDVYVRYQSFSDQQDMEREMQKKCPWKIDLGAVYSHRPKDQKTVRQAAFQAQEKELVFDIDLTDYDDVRNCCSGADVCQKCWPLMSTAVKILDRALQDDFGFKHILWVFSGRRGIHCWVCDDVARKLSQAGRTAVAEYLNIVKGGENQLRKVRLDSFYVHPSVQEALKIVEEIFDDYACQQQDFLADEEKWNKVLTMLPSEEIRTQIAADFDKKKDSAERWSRLKRFVMVSTTMKDFRECQRAVEDIMLQHCYPRLDINVTVGMNHLLKSPFCVHPKTGRVCIPLDPKNIDSFSPTTVPVLSQLVEELNARPTKVDEFGRKMKDYMNTAMAEGVAVFEQFVKKLEESRRSSLHSENEKKMDF